MNNQISILGTGWLGLPLAKRLLENGYTIHGATTSTEKLVVLEEQGISPFCIELTEHGCVGDPELFLRGSNVLIINIPPGLRRHPTSNFVAKIECFIPYIEASSIQKVLFISSTSVYADLEDMPKITARTLPNAISNAGKQLIKVEQLFMQNTHFETTILRFAGLFDHRRHPAMMLSKRSGIKNPKAPVNLIHLEDCLGIITQIILENKWEETFNAAYPDHPEKASYYTEICTKMGLPLPEYDFETPSKGKVINSEKILKELPYTFGKKLY